MNRVVLVGRLTRDPELRTSGSGNSFVNFSIAVNRNYSSIEELMNYNSTNDTNIALINTSITKLDKLTSISLPYLYDLTWTQGYYIICNNTSSAGQVGQASSMSVTNYYPIYAGQKLLLHLHSEN